MPFATGIYFPKARNYLWFVSFVFLILFIYVFTTKNPNEIKIEKENVGVYVLNIDESSLENSDIRKYSKSILIVKSDNTFEIKGDIPFLSKRGTWKVKEGIDYCIKECFFDNGRTFQLYCNDDDSWSFPYRTFKGSSEKDIIVFTKKKYYF